MTQRCDLPTHSPYRFPQGHPIAAWILTFLARCPRIVESIQALNDDIENYCGLYFSKDTPLLENRQKLAEVLSYAFGKEMGMDIACAVENTPAPGAPQPPNHADVLRGRGLVITAFLAGMDESLATWDWEEE